MCFIVIVQAMPAAAASLSALKIVLFIFLYVRLVLFQSELHLMKSKDVRSTLIFCCFDLQDGLEKTALSLIRVLLSLARTMEHALSLPRQNTNVDVR